MRRHVPKEACEEVYMHRGVRHEDRLPIMCIKAVTKPKWRWGAMGPEQPDPQTAGLSGLGDPSETACAKGGARILGLLTSSWTSAVLPMLLL